MKYFENIIKLKRKKREKNKLHKCDNIVNKDGLKMENREKNILDLAKKLFINGLGLGFIVTILGFVFKNYNKDYLITSVGIGIMVAAMFVLLGGLFISLMEESTGRRN